MNFTKKQQYFLDQVASGQSIFLTGKAGTGKSFIVREAIQRLQDAKKKVVALATTGIAATNIDGQTIHSFFKIPPFGVIDFTSCNYISDKTLLKKVETYIIDEVSMLRPDLLDGMHFTLRKNGLPGLDTKQVIFVGDMKQLAPIVDKDSKGILYQKYDGETFEFSNIFQKLEPETIVLDEILRQNNPDFIEALNAVREGGKHQYFKNFVHKEPQGIVLAPYNATVAQYNQAGLNAQEGRLYHFPAFMEGNAKPEDFNFEMHIEVKEGCKIMYLANSPDTPLRNGTLGIFVKQKAQFYIKVDDGQKFLLEPVTLAKKKYVYNKAKDALELEEIGSMTQYPFKLAYALSIHKAQGLTFDQCTIDLRRGCFAPGQLYVALSRVRTPEGLRIITK